MFIISRHRVSSNRGIELKNKSYRWLVPRLSMWANWQPSCWQLLQWLLCQSSVSKSVGNPWLCGECNGFLHWEPSKLNHITIYSQLQDNSLVFRCFVGTIVISRWKMCVLSYILAWHLGSSGHRLWVEKNGAIAFPQVKLARWFTWFEYWNETEWNKI